MDQAHLLAQTAAANLQDATLDDQAALIALLGIWIKTTDDGYEISDSIPIGDLTEGGKTPTRDLQHP